MEPILFHGLFMILNGWFCLWDANLEVISELYIFYILILLFGE